MSLKLFEILLKKPNEHIINNLVLRNLQSRAYVDRTALPPPTPEEDHNPQEPETIEGAVQENENNEGSVEENQANNLTTTHNNTEQSGDNERTEQSVDCNTRTDSTEPDQLNILTGVDALTNGPESLGVDDLINSIENDGVIMTEHIGNGGPAMSLSEPNSPMFDLPVSLLNSTPMLVPPNPPSVSLLSYPVTLVGSPAHSDISATPSASSVDSGEDSSLGIHRIVNW